MDLAEIKEWWDTFGPQNHFNPRVAERFTWLLTETARLTTDNAALTAENARIFAMVDAREQTIAELTALCDEYRGEIQTLTNTVEYLKQEDGREIQRLKVACECHRIQAVDRGNSYQKAASEVERLQAIVTALEEGCHSCQHPKRVGELTCQKNALQQVVAERDTEIERLKHWDSLLCPRCHGVREVTVMSGQTPESYSEENIPCPDCVGPIIDERDAAVSALTRARADAFEESAEIASDTLYNTVIWGCDGDCNSPEIVAKAIRARAAKGEQ